MADGDPTTRHGTAVSFGYHVRRRRLGLDLTQAALAGRVGCSTATIKKIERDERRPSRDMARSLAEALRVPAGDRAAFVAAGTGQRSPAALVGQPDGPALGTAAPTPGQPPGWLLRAPHAGGSAAVTEVVGRDAELAVLDAHLAAAGEGDGRLVLVSGEAGQGKTALLTEFARRAHLASPDVVVSSTQGTAVGGLGDPYLPFRELLLMLLVDPDARWQADRLTERQKERLWRFAPTVARTIPVTGPQLVGTLVPPGTLLERAGSSPPVAAPGPGVGGPPSGDRLVSQLSSTFLALARQRPLLLVIDDLQWVDAASAEFLFQLARRLEGSRILLVGAYRPSELSGERGLVAGSAGAVVRLAVRDAGARRDGALVTLEPDEPAQARRLCDALIDREPNRLDEGFRQALFELTGGLPCSWWSSCGRCVTAATSWPTTASGWPRGPSTGTRSRGG